MTRHPATGWWRRWSAAVWPLVVVLAVLTVEVRFLARSSWRPVVRYDGDSLTFPILWHALASGEPMRPVMSPQLLLFPEGVIYAVAHFCTTSVGASIVAVAYINVVLFYLGLRAVATVVVDGSPERRRVAALVPTLLLIAAMLLERVTGINTTTIATPLLFDSFYAGVILIGIGTVVFAARQLRWPATRSRSRRLTISAVATGVLALTIISDPLFLVQVTGPFLVVVLALWALRLSPRRSWPGSSAHRSAPS
jgi:AcrR family transcriptional regulator